VQVVGRIDAGRRRIADRPDHVIDLVDGDAA
jgi:hypothetical protein